MVRLRLIGQMEAWTLTSENVLPAGRKTRALLAVIALSSPRPALRGRLAELLWSRRPEEQARASLRQEIHRLLESLAPAGTEILVVTRDHLSLRPGVVWVDVEEVMRATTDQPASLSLLDGDLLEDLDGIDPTFDAWLTTERERLRDRARTVAEALLREQVEPEAAIPAAQRLLQIDRAHEGAWRALMRAHAARGERGMAIQAYDRCRAVLADLLDASPSPETQKLLAEIRGPSGSRMPLRPPAPPPSPRPRRSRSPTNRRRCWSRNTRKSGRRAAAPMSASCRCNSSAPPRRNRISHPAWPTRSPPRWPASAGCSSSRPTRWRASPPRSRDETAIRRTFGIDFLLDGSIQRVRNRLRITVRLLDLRAGNQVVWARRFDRQSNDLLSLQDEIASEVVAQIDPEILLIEAKRSASRPPMDATAYDLVLRAIPLIGRMERGRYMHGRRVSGRRRSSWNRTTPRRRPGTPTGTYSWSGRVGRTTRAP